MATSSIPLAHPLFSASKVAQVFMANILKLHGMPTTIVSNRYPIFTVLSIKSSLSFREFPLPLVRLITHNQMVRLKPSTNAWRPTYVAIPALSLNLGTYGYFWQNGGTIPSTTLRRVVLHLKPSMITFFLPFIICSRHVCQSGSRLPVEGWCHYHFFTQGAFAGCPESNEDPGR
jgi:hypothetical protein